MQTQAHEIRVREVMSTAPVTIRHDLTLADAAERMFNHKIRHLPVTEGEHLVGMLSERDISMIASIPTVDRTKVRVEQAMSSRPYTCGPDERLIEVVRHMVDDKQGSVVVMQDGKVIGIVTTIDVLALMMNLLGA